MMDDGVAGLLSRLHLECMHAILGGAKWVCDHHYADKPIPAGLQSVHILLRPPPCTILPCATP